MRYQHKMKKTILYFFLMASILCLALFYYSNKRIDGIYVKVIEINNYKNGKDFIIDSQKIVKIEEQKIVSHHFNYSESNDFFVIGNVIKQDLNFNEIGHLNYNIKTVNRDSLVLTTNGINEQKKVFLRLPDTLKATSNFKDILLDKSFKLVSEHGIDTVHFDENFLLNKISLKDEEKWGITGLSYDTIDDFQILYTGMSRLFIFKENKNRIFLYLPSFDKTYKQFELIEIRSDKFEILKTIEDYQKYENLW